MWPDKKRLWIVLVGEVGDVGDLLSPLRARLGGWTGKTIILVLVMRVADHRLHRLHLRRAAVALWRAGVFRPLGTRRNACGGPATTA